MYDNTIRTSSPLWQWVEGEYERQKTHLELIASENYVCEDILKLQGSILTNKYAEGYPYKRYYGGCEFVDHIEDYAQKLACSLFGAQFANVQPHSGSSANLAVYHALLAPGDKVMGLDLRHGGHLTHGSPVNFSGLLYQAGHYTLSETGILDYQQIAKQVELFRPKLLIAGYSAYSRNIDWKAFREIADSVGAYLLADISHISGMIATRLHASPFPWAHVVTSTTHKTLRGPRGGLILANDPVIMKKIDSAIFPGSQGGPLMHVIAAKARCFELALEPHFRQYQEQILKNAATLAHTLVDRDIQIISGGTDNHLLLISLAHKNFSGKEAQFALEKAHMTVNRNTIPGDQRSAQQTSGIRIGSPALTTRGMKESQMTLIAHAIADILESNLNPNVIEQRKKDMVELSSNFELFAF